MNLLGSRTGPSDELDEIRALARPLGEPMDLDPLLERIGDARYAAWQCFEPYEEDPQRYAWATRMVPASCESEVVELLVDLHRAPALLADDDPEAELDALQNAEVLAGAERYYRAMVQADGDSWNVRDCHMADTLDRLVAHHGPEAKVVVWEHNTHVGDARATDMATVGLVNVGQLVRERHGAEGVVLVGFGGHHGEVVAGSSWGAPMQRLAVGSPPPGTRRYDAFCSFDRTAALHSLHREEAAAGGEQETYPWTT
jgi:erythromycin esterase-like protein